MDDGLYGQAPVDGGCVIFIVVGRLCLLGEEGHGTWAVSV